MKFYLSQPVLSMKFKAYSSIFLLMSLISLSKPTCFMDEIKSILEYISVYVIRKFIQADLFYG